MKILIKMGVDMIAFLMYLIGSVFCAYGLLMFLWWWKKTGKATTIYIYVTLLFGAELIEKIIHMWTGYILVVEQNHSLFVDILLSDLWWLSEFPSLVVFTIIIFIMTRRIYHTAIELKRAKEKKVPTEKNPDRNVLVISKVKKTKDFMRSAFIINNVKYYEADNLLQGYELMVRDKYVSVIMIGLNVIEECGFSAQRIIDGIKRENPWCIVVALSRTPNLYELFSSRRAYFDDYVYLPVDANILLATYERWISRITRWHRIEGKDRRIREGMIWDRRTIRSREKSQ